MSLLHEIKRRKVFQVAAMYLVAGWLLVQVFDVVKEPLQLPAWVHPFVIVLVAIGFPIVLMLGWAFELTRGGVVVEHYDDGVEIKDSANREQEKIGGESSSRITKKHANWAITAVIIVSLIFAGYLAINVVPSDPAINTSTADRSVRRFTIELPRNLENASLGFRPVSISADGQRLIFVGVIDDQWNLYSRSMNNRDVFPIEGTENTRKISIVSPDGKWIAFVDGNGVLKKVPASGGVPVALCDTNGFSNDNIAWGTNDNIVFTSSTYRGLMQVSSSGGQPEPVTFPEADETHKNPAFLPDGSALLYAIGERGQRPSQSDRIGVIALDSGIQRVLGAGASPQLTASGHLIFYRNNALWAVDFDADRLEMIGESIAVLNGVVFDHFAYYAISHDGSLVYLPLELEKRSLMWVDRMGNEEEIPVELQHYIGPRISPNGNQISVTIRGPEGPDLWLYSLTRGTWDRLTFDESQEWSVVWDPTGRYIYFSADRIDDLYRATTDGTAIVEQLTDTDTNEVANSITPDGKQLIYHTNSADTQADLKILTLGDERTSEVLLRTDFHESYARVSPDGRWLAYQSDRTGRNEVYVRPFPETESAVWQISNGGGYFPSWGRGGNDIFYWGPSALMVAELETDPSFVPGLARGLFSLQDDFGRRRTPLIGPTSPDERFLFSKMSTGEQFPNRQIVVVQNWLDEVVRRIESN